MIEIITLVLCGVNTITSLILIMLFVKNRVGGNQDKNGDVGGNVYCSNCCQPYAANLKICPKCGTPKKGNK
ncbi:MAG: hypothetical protein K2G88_04275 [Oscillospiraceae bacterium]|nr:hypothetical protein [Oscillospiraceae bacterium]